MALFSKILDFFGRPVDPQPDVELITGATAVERIRDRQLLDNVLSDVTPERLRAVFEEADTGAIGRQVELAELMEERDEQLRTVLEVRRLAPLAVQWEVQPGDGTPEAAKVADAFREVWDSLDAQSPLERLQYAILPQWHVERVLWDKDGRLEGRPFWRPIGFVEADGRKLAWPMVSSEQPGDVSAVVPGLMENWNRSELTPLKAGAYVVHNYRARRGKPGRMALVRACAFLWMLKRYGWIDFGTLLEQFGKPWRVVKYDPTASAAEIRSMLGTLREAASDLAIAIPKGSELALEAGMTSVAHLPHTDLVKLVNEAFSKLVVGSTTITDAAQNSESVSSPTHSGVRRDLRDADCRALAATINRDLVGPFTLWNFGESVAAPKLQPVLAEKADPATRGNVYDIALNKLRIPVVAAQVYDDLGLQRPDGVPDILEPAAPAADPFGGLGGLSGLFGQPRPAAVPGLANPSGGQP